MSGIALAAATIGALVLPAFLPRRGVRVLGALFAALIAVALLRALGAPALGYAAAAVGVGGTALHFAPGRVLRRLCFLVPSLFLLVYVTTWLMYQAPGNPFANERVASPEVEQALRAQYGVPETAPEFFRVYLRRLLVDGSLGPSIKVQGRSVGELLAPAIPVSLALGGTALVLAVTLGLALGVLAGLRPRTWVDHVGMGVALVGVSLPNFVIGAGLLIVFALGLRWLPVAGFGSPAHLVLPALTLALPYAAVIARLARASTLEVMAEDFVRTARARGVPEYAVVLGHALRGILVPVVSYLGPAAAGILTGSFVVETLFGIPGMGQWFVKGAINRDYSVVLGTALFYASLVTVFNLVVDGLYAWIDPRVRETA